MHSDKYFSYNCMSGIDMQWLWIQVIGVNIERRYDCLAMLCALLFQYFRGATAFVPCITEHTAL